MTTMPTTMGNIASLLLRIVCAVFFLAVGLLQAVLEPWSRIVSLACMFVAIFCLFIPSIRIAGLRTPRIALAIIGWMIVYAAFSSMRPSCTFDDLIRQGTPLLVQIEAYRTSHGRYPESLEAAGIESENVLCGTVKYDPIDDGTHYGISITDRDGHAGAVWNSRMAKSGWKTWVD